MRQRLPVLVLALVFVAACSSDPQTPTRSAPIPSAPVTSAAAPPSSAASSLPTSSPSVAPQSSASVSASPCGSAALRLTVREGDSGAGQGHQLLVLVNRGAPCSLHGYPGVSFLDAGGRQLGSPAVQNPAPVRRVQLATGGSAAALLTYSNAEAYPDSSCRPKQASTVRVYPPGQRRPLTVADAVLVCSLTGAGQLRIGPMTPG
jgi:hypothetical protein